LTLLLVFAWSSPVLAQKQNFKLGGGGGFTFPSTPGLSLKRGYDLGGFLGIRFNDNFSLETGFSFGRSESQFFEQSAEDLALQQGEAFTFTPSDPQAEFVDFQLTSTRYHLDTILVYNLGRRQPFHPFIFAGAGLLRDDTEVTDLTPLRATQDPAEVETIELEKKKDSKYYPVVSFGAGFEFYVLQNTAARFEWRWHVTKEWERRTHRLFFAAIYFF
jgi:hypothetical protein